MHRHGLAVFVLVVAAATLSCGEEASGDNAESYCVGTVQEGVCEGDGQCDLGFRCLAGRCGVPCTASDQCAGGRCFGHDPVANNGGVNNGNNGANNGNNGANNGNNGANNGVNNGANNGANNGNNGVNNGANNGNNGANNGNVEYSCDYEPSGTYAPPETDNCNLITQEGCAPGEGCYPQEGAATCFGSAGGKCGSMCTNGNDCREGTLCVNFQGVDGGRCAAICEAGTTCPDGTTCGGLQSRTDIGVCVYPSG